MKDTLTRQNSQDFRQRYLGTFGIYSNPLTKEETLVKLTDINEEVVHFVNKDNIPGYFYADSGVEFKFFQVERQVANYSTDKVLYMHRTPARQWRRSVHNENTRVVDMVSRRAASVGFPVIEVMMKKDQSGELAKFFKGDRLNVALDNKFSIIKDDILIYDLPIGKYEGGKCKVGKLFKQEFTDLVNRNKFPLNVELYNG